MSPTIAITNEPVSALGDAADRTIPLGAGPERAIAATKTYTSELLAIALLSAALAGGIRPIGPRWRRCPRRIARTLALEPEIERIARTRPTSSARS